MNREEDVEILRQRIKETIDTAEPELIIAFAQFINVMWGSWDDDEPGILCEHTKCLHLIEKSKGYIYCGKCKRTFCLRHPTDKVCVYCQENALEHR